MSVQSEINRIEGNIASAYTAVSGKGGTLPAVQNSDNLASAIGSIPMNFIPTSEKGAANGVASLGSDGKVPNTQLPPYIEPWVSTKPYAAGAYCVHNGYIWHNTSGAASTGVEPGTNYNVWNVTYSNVNLLDNPWYNVNQRGQSEYSAEGISIMCVDRHMIYYGDYKVGTKTFFSASVYGQIFTICPPSQMDELDGKIVTISILYKTDDNGWVQRNLPSGEDIELPVTPATVIISHTYTYNKSFEYANNLYNISNNTVGAKITIEAVKLELGSISTLANDTAPNYAEELAKCQRYFQIFKTQMYRHTDKDDFRPVMRVNPAMSTITIGGATYYTASADL